jgi:predicted  nucleic acid-binding Zn-ribbon protein
MRDLLEMRKEIETNRSKLERAQGVLDDVKAELKRDYGFDTIQEADDYLVETEKILDELNKKAEKLQAKISQELDEIHGRTKEI